MTTSVSLTPSPDRIKSALAKVIEPYAEKAYELATSGASKRTLETFAWEAAIAVGAALMSGALAVQCAMVTEEDIVARGINPEDVRIRTDGNYVVGLMTTFGLVTVMLYGYRDFTNAPVVVTRSPARDKVFPLHSKCRSSELCLEWESRLAGEHPFRTAEGMLTYFTHGAVKLEDTTIERHAVRVGHLIDQQWLYRSRPQIVEILRKRATLDAETQRPIVYWSSDAHALRRYVNETWKPEWKMMNGIRVWCVDRDTGAIIHLGGEFTCGDALYTRERMQQLLTSGVLPADGDFGDGLVTQYVFVSDGMPWLEEHLVPLLTKAIVILDAYHLIEHLSEYARDKRRVGTLNANAWLDDVREKTFGQRERRATQHTRKEHRKSKRKLRLLLPPPARLEHSGENLLRQLREEPRKIKSLVKLIRYVEDNIHRMDYLNYRARGFQIGSGAMESFHRTGSQQRLKRPGAKWLPETVEAMFRLRMLELAGRWNEWWQQDGFFHRNADRFIDIHYRTKTGPRATKQKTMTFRAAA